MADKLRTTQQLEALQNKYVGTGHADTTRFEWTSNIQRDSLASYVGHPPLLSYMTLAMGEGTREEMRVKLIEKMVRPVGPPPEVRIHCILSQVSLRLTLLQTRDQEWTITDIWTTAFRITTTTPPAVLYQHPAPLS
jgi:splicing factor 3B subunit 5